MARPCRRSSIRTAARGLFGPGNPIGRRIRAGETSYTVVGLAKDTQPRFLRSKPDAMMFLPFTTGAFRKNPAQVTTVLLRGAPGPGRAWCRTGPTRIAPSRSHGI